MLLMCFSLSTFRCGSSQGNVLSQKSRCCPPTGCVGACHIISEIPQPGCFPAVARPHGVPAPDWPGRVVKRIAGVPTPAYVLDVGYAPDCQNGADLTPEFPGLAPGGKCLDSVFRVNCSFHCFAFDAPTMHPPSPRFKPYFTLPASQSTLYRYSLDCQLVFDI